MDLKFIIHYGLHFLLPLGISYYFFKRHWLQVYLIFIASMLVDLDHLLSDPIFDANRCSINFHFLHGYLAILVYFGMTFFKKTKILGFALLLHMLTDKIDCYL